MKIILTQGKSIHIKTKEHANSSKIESYYHAYTVQAIAKTLSDLKKDITTATLLLI